MKKITSNGVYVFSFLLVCFLAPPKNAAAQETYEPARSGFTFLVKAGTGFQQDAALGKSAFGFGGFDIGIGDFLNENLAVMLRLSAVEVTYDNLFNFNQTSGFAGATLQYWMASRFYIEGGPGVGFSRLSNFDNGYHAGISVLAGAGMSLRTWGKHNILIGIEYSPAFFASDDIIHNAGLRVGYQLY